MDCNIDPKLVADFVEANLTQDKEGQGDKPSGEKKVRPKVIFEVKRVILKLGSRLDFHNKTKGCKVISVPISFNLGISN